jgi:DNA-binding winged helix-turn-helix (wHTH) protein/tetratricopeptide (TPR) repeat protein
VAGAPSVQAGCFAFGCYRLSADGTLLVRDGMRVPLGPKVLQTLRVLVERAGDVVKRADLLEAVWPDSYVEETGLSRNISLLRQALGDDEQTLIVTVARVGYRFAAPVAFVDAEPAQRGARASDRDGSAESPIVPGATPTRLLILPFRLLREDSETGFLAFSVPDAVVNALTGLESLVVRSSAAASRFDREQPDLRQIAAEAGVDVVVTGSLLRSGEQIRMSAQLLAMPSGTVLWSDSVQVALCDVFALQDRLVEHIVGSLSLSLTLREQRRLKRDVPSSPSAYECFLRGNEAIGAHAISSTANLRVARELYARAVDEDPRFAPAWARLGRCHYLLAKFEQGGSGSDLARAESCFQQALALNPDLPLVDNLYALLEIDQGRAPNALIRLIARGLAGSQQPELYAALVQACRFCGLAEASLAAHARVRALDPTLATSVYHTCFQLGDWDRALRETSRPPILDALVIGMRGDPARAAAMLREREERGPTGLLRHFMATIRAVFERRRDDALANARVIFEAFPDPEFVFYVARALAFFGEPEATVEMDRALRQGFVFYRALTVNDPWLAPLRATPEFQRLLERSRDAYRESLRVYVEAGGDALLGAVPEPEAVERAAIGSRSPGIEEDCLEHP